MQVTERNVACLCHRDNFSVEIQLGAQAGSMPNPRRSTAGLCCAISLPDPQPAPRQAARPAGFSAAGSSDKAGGRGSVRGMARRGITLPGGMRLSDSVHDLLSLLGVPPVPWSPTILEAPCQKKFASNQCILIHQSSV